MKLFLISGFIGFSTVAFAKGDVRYSSLESARDAARTIHATRPDEHCRMMLADGKIRVTDAVLFDSRDHDVEFVGGRGTRISGFVVLPPAKVLGNGLWEIPVPGLKDGKTWCSQLVVNGRLANPARWPKRQQDWRYGMRRSDFLKPDSVRESFVTNPITGTVTIEQSILGKTGVHDFLRAVPEENVGDIALVVCHKWNVTRRRVRRFNADANEVVTFGRRPFLRHVPWDVNSVYYFENVPAGSMDEGEWSSDRQNGRILYRPRSGESASRAEIEVPKAGFEHLILGDGMQNVTFRNLIFEGTDAQGEIGQIESEPVQAAAGTSAAMIFDNSTGVVFRACTVRWTGAYGLWMREGCDRCSVESSHVFETGAGGLRMGYTNACSVSTRLRVSDTEIRGTGRINASGVGLFVLEPRDSSFVHNWIHDTTYSGLSMGWHWHYGGTAQNNEIGWNVIEDVGLGGLTDLGCIYTLGECQGTRIHDNILRRVDSHRFCRWTLYFDQSTTGVTAYNNLCYDGVDGGFNFHYGKDCVVSNNIFAAAIQNHMLTFGRVEKHLQLTFVNNVVAWDSRAKHWDRPRFDLCAVCDYGLKGVRDYSTLVLDRNLYWDFGGRDIRFRPAIIDSPIARWQDVVKKPDCGFDEWRRIGYDRHGVIADPLFVDFDKRDFRLKSMKNAKKIGFKPWDFGKAGIRQKSIRNTDHPTYDGPRKAVECNVRDGIGNVMRKIRDGREIVVAYFGGSITAQDGWRRLSREWLTSRYPNARFKEVHAAIGGTGSSLGVYRLGTDVLTTKPDLLFVEFATNDNGLPPEAIWSRFDGIIRQTWRSDPLTDIVFVYTITSSMMKDYEAGVFTRAASAMEQIADYYGIPSIGFGPRVAAAAKAGRLVMSTGEASTAVPAETPGRDKKINAELRKRGKVLFSKDGTHPTLSGHAYYLESLKAGWCAMEKTAPVDHARHLDTPFFSAEYDLAKMVPVTSDMLKGEGWENYSQNDLFRKRFLSKTKNIWHTGTPGDKLAFTFEGTKCLVYDIVGPDCAQVCITVDGVRQRRTVPRFDHYCTYHRISSGLPVFDGPDGVHAVEIEVDRLQPDRSAVLSKSQGEDVGSAKYDGTNFFPCQLQVVGRIVKGGCAAVSPSDTDTIRLEGEYPGHLQDVWIGGHTIWWAHTQFLLKTGIDGRIDRKAEVGGHHAGLEVRDGHLYTAVCAFNGEPRGKTTPACHVMIGEYDAETLDRIAMHVMDINDRAGSLCILEDGTFLVGCLRHPALKPTEVKFHHVGKDYKLIKTYIVDVGQPVKLGIEVIRRYGDNIYLFIYGGPLMRLDAKTLAVTGRFKDAGGQKGFVKGDGVVWTGFSMRKEKGDKASPYVSKLVKCPFELKPL